MVQLFEQDIKTNDRQSSKGNQLKWCRNNVWYKADYMGYEGLVEYVVSRLLEKSSLKQEEYVLYKTEEISYKRRKYLGNYRIYKSIIFTVQNNKVIVWQ